ncbi:hypothetical protein MMC13_004957 [Lambiella insularis]|nr:hypothetical protein [Lambiella insularis]
MLLISAAVLASCSLAAALTITSPTAGSTVDMTSNAVNITWTTNSTDPALINLMFSGFDFATEITDPAGQLLVNVSSSLGVSTWDANAANAGSPPTTVFYLGSPFNIDAGDTKGNTIATSANFTVKNLAGNTNTAAGPTTPNTATHSQGDMRALTFGAALACVLLAMF